MSRIGVMAGVSCLSSLGPEQKARAATSTCANAAEAIDDSYEAWQFKQNCSVHNCMIGIALSSCVCTALLFDLDKEAKLRAVLRAAFSAAFILMRIGAQEAKDQLRAQRFMVTTLYVLTVIRLSSETFSKAASPDTLEVMICEQMFCATRAFLLMILLPSMAAPMWSVALLNALFAAGSWHKALQLLSSLPISSGQMYLPVLHVLISVATLGLAYLQDKQARSLYALMKEQKVACEEKVAATRRAAESEQRAMDAERVAHEESLQMRNRYVGAMSHDFGTPVAVLKMLLGLLRMRIESDEEKRLAIAPEQPPTVRVRSCDDNAKLLDLVRRASAALELLEVIRQKALAYSKLQAGADLEPTFANFSPTELLEKVASITRDMRKTTCVQVEVCVSPEVPAVVRSDRNWLFMVLINLASNSIKHTAEGTLTLSAFVDDEARLSLQVRDTGSGVPAHFVPKLFEPFSSACTAKSSVESTGLGLYHSKQLARLLEGELSHAPNRPRGAVFTAHVPLLPPSE